MKMRLSQFGYVKDIDDIARAGFDCIEMHYSELMSMDDAQYKAAKSKLMNSGLTAEVFNNPVPLTEMIIDDAFDMNYYRDYLNRQADLAAGLGARYCNFGNGKTRCYPLDGNPEKTKKVDDFIKMLCEINAERNITVLLEPLTGSLSNFCWSFQDAIDYKNKMGIRNMKTFIDLRWFVAENHPYEDIIKYEDYIVHAHIDNPLTEFPHGKRERRVPKLGDCFDYGPFLEALKKICFKGLLSIEASTFDNFYDDICDALKLFAHYGIEPYRLK